MLLIVHKNLVFVISLISKRLSKFKSIPVSILKPPKSQFSPDSSFVILIKLFRPFKPLQTVDCDIIS